MGDRRPWTPQVQPLRPFKAWTPNCKIAVRASRVMAEADAESGAKETKTYGFAWDEDAGALLACYEGGRKMDPADARKVLTVMADDKTASPENRRAAKRILKAIKSR